MQPTDKGNVVYTVDASNIAHVKSVTLGMHTPEGGVEITQGLAVGDLLVVRGFEPLSEGAPVLISDRTTLDALQGDAGPPGATGSADDGGAAATAPVDSTGPATASAASAAGAAHRRKDQ